MTRKRTGPLPQTLGRADVESFDVYRHPDIYDLAFARCLDADIMFFEAVFRGLGKRPIRRLLDLGSGTGNMVIELARRGYECGGVDSSSKMVAYAKQTAAEAGVSAEFRAGRIEHLLSGGEWDAALCLTGTIHHLVGNPALRAHFRSVGRCLAQGGVYVVDVLITRAEDEPVEIDQGWSVSQGGRQVEVAFRFDPDRYESRRARRWVSLETTLVEGGRRRSCRNEHWFAVVTEERLLGLAGNAGLRHLGWYSGHGGLRLIRRPHQHPGVYGVFLKE